MKKAIKIFASLFFVVFVISGCGGRDQRPVNMDELSKDNKYHYSNQMLGFSVELPDTFEYYQTQRTEGDNFTELEIFVPTNDTSKHEEVPGYANPVTIRVYSRDAWSGAKDSVREEGYAEVGRSDDDVYAIKFWQEAPSDWEDRWSTDAANDIKDSLELL